MITGLTSILFKGYFALTHPGLYIGTLPFSHFDAFAMGALVAYLPFSKRPGLLQNRALRMGIFAICVIVVFFLRDNARLSFLFNLFFSGASVLLIHQAQKGFTGAIGWVLNLPFLQYLGKISYGLYVYHNFMPWLLRCLKGQEDQYPLPIAILRQPVWNKPLIEQVTQFVLLVLIASLSWFLFEKPIINLKNLLPQPKQASPQV
jgi:peptidoglycan/LPS O-acetylase OafA/YrhL